MKKLLLIPLLYLPLLVNADSTVLRETMGESVYEQSGIDELSDDQIKVLEKWILDNAVETRVVDMPKPAAPTRKEMAPTPAPEPELVEEVQPEVVETKVEEESAPRYVRLAKPEEQEKPAEEEAVTQKYVLVDSLEESDRNKVQPDLIRSRIDGPFKGWKDNRTRFKLENGEIWEQRQSSTYRTNLDSPEVIIRKRRFGYSMEVPAIGRSVLVKRIR